MITHNPWEYTEILSPGALVYLSIACTTFCNFKCVFCSKKDKKPEHLDYTVLIRTIKQAIDLGLTKVELTGGEPLLYPWFWEIADFLLKENISLFIVTNGSLITKEIAQQLADCRISVSVSLQTLVEHKFDILTGSKGQLPKICMAVQFLKEAGYSENEYPVIAIQSVASKDTIDEIKKIQNWAQNRGCMFILNRPIPVGGMSMNALISGMELQELLSEEQQKCAEIPFSLDSPCNRLKAGCYVNSSGTIQPCPAIHIDVGSLYTSSLASIWHDSDILNTCRNISDALEGSCGNCKEKHRCYGCRAVAWAFWQSLTAPDPGCFHFKPDTDYTIKG